MKEPVRVHVWTCVLSVLLSTSVYASGQASFELLNPLSVLPQVGLVQKALRALRSNIEAFDGSVPRAVGFENTAVIADDYSTTVRFTQNYNQIEVYGHDSFVHFDRDGIIHDVAGSLGAMAGASEKATLTAAQALQIAASRHRDRLDLSEATQLKLYQDSQKRLRLVYVLMTRDPETLGGRQIFVDARSGDVLLDLSRVYDADFKGTVFSADTPAAHEHIGDRGAPTGVNLDWYLKDATDESSIRANRNSEAVYTYYKSNFNRRSYDNANATMVSVAHMGLHYNNAFWSDAFKIMAYGDGDGERLNDLTNGLDVAAHEMTHAVTANTAKLVYAAEPGALNESYSDVFGKMVDYTEGNWYIGGKVMANGALGIRNLKNPGEFGQPDTATSPLRVPTPSVEECAGPFADDYCGVHTNSGIPNRAAALIAEAIGKQNAEQLYYKVLSTRLSATSDFKDARKQTEEECSLKFNSGSRECNAVSSAFETVGM